MNGISAGDFACCEQGWNIEIGIAARGRADADALIGEPHMHRVGVSRRMHGYSCDTELFARAENPEGYFATIGNQDLLKHVFPACCLIRSR
jgi:hypothetical protein